jgi:hypothetical protein
LTLVEERGTADLDTMDGRTLLVTAIGGLTFAALACSSTEGTVDPAELPSTVEISASDWGNDLVAEPPPFPFDLSPSEMSRGESCSEALLVTGQAEAGARSGRTGRAERVFRERRRVDGLYWLVVTSYDTEQAAETAAKELGAAVTDDATRGCQDESALEGGLTRVDDRASAQVINSGTSVGAEYRESPSRTFRSETYIWHHANAVVIASFSVSSDGYSAESVEEFLERAADAVAAAAHDR